MRLMGIDFGEKRIGIALSDEQGSLAFPHLVIETSKNAPKIIKQICREKNVAKIILGQSIDYKGKPNPVMEEIEKFKIALEKEIGLEVIYQNETLTTQEARRIQGDVKKLDASAAALILRSFIAGRKMV
jgi:putative Holliday junction resolvase